MPSNSKIATELVGHVVSGVSMPEYWESSPRRPTKARHPTEDDALGSNPASRSAQSQATPAAPIRRATAPEPLAGVDLLYLQGKTGNRAVARSVIPQSSASPMSRPPVVVQRTRWVWNGSDWIADGPVNTPKPTFPGGQPGAVFRQEPSGPDPFATAETLPDGTIIDYPALARVMDGVVIGTEVTPAVWRKMRQELSDAITLKNKSHPPHGSNFNKNQRPEQQIADWAAVISGQIRAKLQAFFVQKYGLYI